MLGSNGVHNMSRCGGGGGGDDMMRTTTLDSFVPTVCLVATRKQRSKARTTNGDTFVRCEIRQYTDKPKHLINIAKTRTSPWRRWPGYRATPFPRGTCRARCTRSCCLLHIQDWKEALQRCPYLSHSGQVMLSCHFPSTKSVGSIKDPASFALGRASFCVNLLSNWKKANHLNLK